MCFGCRVRARKGVEGLGLLNDSVEVGVFMMNKSKIFEVLLVIFALGVAGCTGSKPPISITFNTGTSVNVVAGQAVTITATLTNDSKGAGVTWSLSPTTGAGTLSAQTTTSVTYTAPSPVPSNTTATITATSISDSTKAATIKINLQAISVAVSPTTATVASGSSGQFTATVSNDPSSAPKVTWTVTCSVASCGSVAPTTTASGAATTYSGPATPPTSALTVTITATSVTDTTKLNSATITVPPASVSVSPTTATVLAGNTKQFTATVTNTSNTGVTWTVTCSVASCGSLNSSTANPVTYTAPGPPASDLTVTLTATSAADNTKKISATITVPAITVSVAPPSANVPVKGTAAFTATVGNDAANKGATWTLTQSGVACSPGCGTITASTASGAPATYTAPATVPANATVTITAASVSDLSKTAAATVTIVGITVSISPTSPGVVVNGTQSFTAMVSNDISASGVTWTLTQGGVACAPATCGSVSPASGTGNSPSTTYKAPATVPATPTVTLTATSVADTTKFASATITITAAPPISVSIAPSNPSVAVNGTQSFTATVTNDSTGAGVTWTLTQSGASCSPACGSVSPASGTGNSPMTTYTAPAIVPTPATVTISATSAADTTKSASTTITVSAVACGSGSESLLNGQYAFVLKGFDNGTGPGETAPEPVVVGGVITVDGAGHITAGTIDLNGNSTAGVSSNTVTSGSFGVGSDHRGCMTITTAAGTQNYRFSLGGISGGVASTGHMIDFDAAGPFTTGILRKQSASAFSTAQVTGNYAFGVSSVQNSAACVNHGAVCGGNFGAVGVFNLAAGSVTGGQIDDNSGGLLDNNLPAPWPASPVSIAGGGSYTISGSNGRGTFVFPLPNGNVNSIIYVVSSTEVLIMNSQDQTINRVYGGELLQQSGAPFSNSSVSGNYIGYTSGPQSGGGSRTDLLLINANNSADTITATIQQNHGGTFSSQASSGSYSIASNGRMLLTVTGTTTNPSVVLFLANGSEAFVLNDNASADSGLIQAQTSTSASGAYAIGIIDPAIPNVGASSGVVTLTSGNLGGATDNNSSGGTQANQSISGTYSIDSTGFGVIPSSCTPGTNCQFVFYVISPTEAVLTQLQHSNGTSQTNPAATPADQ
jgi:hypothetical protein